MAIGAVGGCSDCSTEVYRPDKAVKPGQEQLSPVEEAARLAEKTGEFEAGAVDDKRVNPTETAARVATTQALAQAAEVNRLRDGGADEPDKSDEASRRAAVDEPSATQSAGQAYQATEAAGAAEAAESKFPNRGGVLDFQI